MNTEPGAVEKGGGGKNRWAALAAAGTLVISLASEQSPAALAETNAGSVAQLEQGLSAESLSARTRKQLIVIDTQMRSMIQNHSADVYQISKIEKGRKIDRLILSYGALNPQTNQMTYTHIIEDVRPGENLPFRVTVNRGVPQKHFSEKENPISITLLLRNEFDADNYLIGSAYIDEKSNLLTSIYEMNGTRRTATTGKQQKGGKQLTRNISRESMSEVLDNTTSDIMGLLKYAEEEYKREHKPIA